MENLREILNFLKGYDWINLIAIIVVFIWLSRQFTTKLNAAVNKLDADIKAMNLQNATQFAAQIARLDAHIIENATQFAAQAARHDAQAARLDQAYNMFYELIRERQK